MTTTKHAAKTASNTTKSTSMKVVPAKQKMHIDWYAPAPLFESLGFSKTGRLFDLDPCSSGAHNTHVPAKRYLTIEFDGLSIPWEGQVWLNPPFDENYVWLARLADHGNGIAITNARTDNAWFVEQIAGRGATVCFLRQRVRFHKNDMNAPNKGTLGIGQMLIAYGDENAEILRNCGLGPVVTFQATAVALKAAA